MSRDPRTPFAALLAAMVLTGSAVAAPVDDTLAAAAPGVVAASGAIAEEPRYPELPNFHRVDEKLYRGGEPGAGGMSRLKALGVRTVVDLRYERRKGQREETAARAEGLRYFQIPMYGLVRPTDQQIARALALIADPENGPVLVHCERGSDRTGVVVACYRIAHGRWTAQQAIAEAMAHGMYRIEVAKRAFIRDFSARRGS